ncbi:MAG: CBS domain-containing protein [Saprospiraceae bacterium]|nr:CBS domain-containing protein [Saprospiraceae bacterium]
MFDRTTTIANIMTSEVFFVHPDDTMQRIDEIFRMHNIHHVPVIDQIGHVVGIISKSDYLKVLHGFTMFKTAKSEEYNKAILRSLLASEVMTTQVASLNPDDTVDVAAGYFRENLFHAIPVVDRDKRLVGIVTTFDLLNFAFMEPALLQ